MGNYSNRVGEIFESERTHPRSADSKQSNSLTMYVQSKDRDGDHCPR